jgi:hypothetical protein
MDGQTFSIVIANQQIFMEFLFYYLFYGVVIKLFYGRSLLQLGDMEFSEVDEFLGYDFLGGFLIFVGKTENR